MGPYITNSRYTNSTPCRLSGLGDTVLGLRHWSGYDLVQGETITYKSKQASLSPEPPVSYNEVERLAQTVSIPVRGYGYLTGPGVEIRQRRWGSAQGTGSESANELQKSVPYIWLLDKSTLFA